MLPLEERARRVYLAVTLLFAKNISMSNSASSASSCSTGNFLYLQEHEPDEGIDKMHSGGGGASGSVTFDQK